MNSRRAKLTSWRRRQKNFSACAWKPGQFLIGNDWFEDLGIPFAARQAIRDAWESEPPSLDGRFDLAYDGAGPPMLLEYNANTPTGLQEAAVGQWHRRQEAFPATDQFNSIREKLIAKWSELRRYWRSCTLYFTCMPDEEDLMSVTYLRDRAQQAGITTEHLFVRDIGWNEEQRAFRDLPEQASTSLFALYPWEWLLNDFEGPILSTLTNMDWIEPIWKMLWSNKGLPAILWEMFPRHPNLLSAFLDSPGDRCYRGKAPTLLCLLTASSLPRPVPMRLAAASIKHS